MAASAVMADLVFPSLSYRTGPYAAGGIPMHTIGYGRISAGNGEVFSRNINYSGNYWNGAQGAINHLLGENGGELSGKKIALASHNSAAIAPTT